jgi:hypothetical protein
MRDGKTVNAYERRPKLEGSLFSVVFLCFFVLAPGSAWAQNANAGSESAKGPKSTKNASPWCMHDCGSSREKPYDLKNQTYSGETVRGPVTIVAKNLNILRYKYTANSKVTLSKPPDLWSELTNIANPQSNPAAVPTPTNAANAPNTHAMNAVIRTKGPRAVVAPGGRPVSAAAQAVNDKVKKADDETVLATKAVDDATQQLNPTFHAAIDADFANTMAQVNKANTATGSVNAGGQELLSFLKSVDSSSTYSGIQGELSPASKLMAGVNAQWPASADVAALKISADGRKTILAQMKAEFEGKRASLIAGLNTAQRDLYMASEALEDFALQIRGGANNTDDQTVIVQDRDLLNQRLGEIDKSNRQLNDAAAFLNSGIATNDQMETALSNLDISGDKYKAFQQGQAQLSDWQQQMVRIKTAWDLHSAPAADQYLNPDPFTMRIAGSCDYAFASTKQTAVTLTATDQLPDKSAAAPATVLSVTVECASPFNVSAGVAFNTIPDHEFAIQPVATPPGSTTTTNQFALTANSSFHPVPLGMVSARLWEPDETFALHLSFGLAGNFKSQNAGGSSAEFLIGPSVSFFRTMYITPGLYIGKKTVLANGYTVGSPAPPSVTTPPLQSSYKAAFGLAITFTKP